MKNLFKIASVALVLCVANSSFATTVVKISGTGGATQDGSKITYCPTADATKTCATITSGASIVNGSILNAVGTATWTDANQIVHNDDLQINSITNIVSTPGLNKATSSNCDLIKVN